MPRHWVRNKSPWLHKETQITQLEMGAEGREHHVEESWVLHTQAHLRDW